MLTMRKSLKLISIITVFSVLLSGCGLINAHKFSQMYVDAFMHTNVNMYSQYIEKSEKAFNEELNANIYVSMLKRTTTHNIIYTDDDLNNLQAVVDDFRSDKVKMIILSADETSLNVRIKVYITNVYDILVMEMKKNVVAPINTPEYNQQIITSLTNSLNTSKIVDTVEVEIVLKVDEITGKYYVSEKSQNKIIEVVLGFK